MDIRTTFGTRIRFRIALTAVVTSLAAANVAIADDYPSHPVTVVTPFVPGGMVDASARILAETLSERTGQQFIVENRPGASGNIGYASASRATPDGYTLLLGYSTTSTCNPWTYPNLNWSNEDFMPVASFAGFPLTIIVNSALPVNSLAELIDYLKAHPGEVSYGALGVGSQVHIATELFKQVTDTDIVGAQYKGSGEVISDLISGNVQFVFDAYGPYRQHIEAGTLKALAVAAPDRDPNAPDVPTTAEAGVEGLIQYGFMPVFAPVGTDPAIIAKLSDNIREASENDPLFAERIVNVKLTQRFEGPEELGERLEQLTAECAAVVESAGISIN